MRRIQISRIEMIFTGIAMKNQTAHEGCGDMIASAMIFCGEAMGESMPPTFEARAYQG